MSASLLLARHELRRFAAQAFAWTLAAAVVALMAWQFLLAVQTFLDVAPKLGSVKDAPGVTDLVAIPLLRSFANLLMLVVPLLTMRAFAGERRAGTLPLLLASGVGDLRIVLGKFLGVWTYALLLIALVVAMPLALAAGTALDVGKLAAATAGLVLLSAALVAVGLMCSAWAAQPALAAAGAIALTALLVVIDAGARLQGVVNGVINYLALPTHLEPFFRGVIASVDALYFLLLSGVALAVCVRRLAAMRTRPD